MPNVKKYDLSEKELDAIKVSAKKFLLGDVEALKFFVKKIKEDFGQEDLLFALKMFVLSCNKAFNQKQYMENQSERATKYVKSKDKNFTPEQRRAAFNSWVAENAESYRKEVIFNQIRLLDDIKSYIIPIIEQELKK